MVSLQDMQVLHCSSSASEKTGRLCALPQDEMQDHYLLEYYPEINLNCDAFSSSSIAGSSLSNKCVDSWRSVMVPVNESVMKRIIRTFFESGFNEALNEARAHQTANSNPMISSFAEFTFRTIDFVKLLRSKVFPHTKEQGVASIAKYSETRNWMRSYIRCFAWHPNCFKFAVAGSDDIVRIYTDEPDLVPVLKSSSQKWITSMAWRPFSAGELAIGCQKGICLWTMDNNMNITRSASQAVFLHSPNHCPITSMQWNPDGTLLASASIGDTDVLIWNVDRMQNTALKRVGPPCTLLKWSPDGSCLFSSTVGNVFRVWSCGKKWQPERWTITAGTIQSACWSPCANFLLFVTSAEPFLYRLQFFEEQLFQNDSATKLALPVADLTKISLGEREIGGNPQSMAWDPNGLFLAITFKDSNCIAVFSTALQKYRLNISPCCYFTGIGDEYPSYICFQSKNRINKDSVLTIGWSSGRIQYFPFLNM